MIPHHMVATLITAAFLAGCNASGPSTAPLAAAPQPREQVAAGESDPGPGQCGATIAAFRKILKQDIDMGHVAKSVYDAVAADVERAAATCRAGHDGEARSIVAATKARHGYR